MDKRWFKFGFEGQVWDEEQITADILDIEYGVLAQIASFGTIGSGDAAGVEPLYTTLNWPGGTNDLNILTWTQ